MARYRVPLSRREQAGVFLFVIGLAAFTWFSYFVTSSLARAAIDSLPGPG